MHIRDLLSQAVCSRIKKVTGILTYLMVGKKCGSWRIPSYGFSAPLSGRPLKSFECLFSDYWIITVLKYLPLTEARFFYLRFLCQLLTLQRDFSRKSHILYMLLVLTTWFNFCNSLSINLYLCILNSLIWNVCSGCDTLLVKASSLSALKNYFQGNLYPWCCR